MYNRIQTLLQPPHFIQDKKKTDKFIQVKKEGKKESKNLKTDWFRDFCLFLTEKQAQTAFFCDIKSKSLFSAWIPSHGK